MLFNKDIPESHIEGVMGYLEARLAAHPFVAGEEFTIGDVAVGSHLVLCKVFLPQVRSFLKQHRRACMSQALRASVYFDSRQSASLVGRCVLEARMGCKQLHISVLQECLLLQFAGI